MRTCNTAAGILLFVCVCYLRERNCLYLISFTLYFWESTLLDVLCGLILQGATKRCCKTLKRSTGRLLVWFFIFYFFFLNLCTSLQRRLVGEKTGHGGKREVFRGMVDEENEYEELAMVRRGCWGNVCEGHQTSDCEERGLSKEQYIWYWDTVASVKSSIQLLIIQQVLRAS